MKRGIALLLLLAFFALISAVRASSQEKSAITVRGSELNSGVVILDVLRGDKPCKLQCNQGAPDCTALTNGKYQMVKLPKNFGMYECTDVEVYPDTADHAVSADKKLGEYCLIEK